MLPDRYQTILDRLQKCKRVVSRTGHEEWNALCPAHDDNIPSLCITYRREGHLLAHCRAGCTFAEIVRALGTEQQDWFPPTETFPLGNVGRKRTMHMEQARKQVAVYPYHDDKNKLLYEVVRYEPKHFACRRPDGNGGFAWNLDGVTKVLYNLPEILAKPEQPVLVVEGEKDVETLRQLGFVATTNQGGAGKWQPEYSRVLRGRRVAILPDNDPQGHKHALEVAGSLMYWGAASIRIVHLPGICEKGDISDWVADTVPGPVSQLRQALLVFIRDANEYKASRVEKVA